jgi:tetratricopeptide (TPR) repeat protein
MFWLSVNSSYIGDAAQALKYAEKVRVIDPLLPINAVIKGVAYIYDGQFDEARPWIDRALAMDSTSTIMIWTAAIADAWCGKTAEAIDHVDKLAQLAPNWVYTQHGLFLKHALLGEKELALQYESAELTKEAEHDCHFALHVAHCFALIHEKDKALDFLELAVHTGMVNHPFLSKFDPLLASLRSEERFKSLMSETENLAEKVKASL